MKHKDIWRAANLLIEQHGADAELLATRRIDDMIAEGDPVGERVWKDIRNAIVQLRRTRGSVLH